jgi:hypothetical protein
MIRFRLRQVGDFDISKPTVLEITGLVLVLCFFVIFVFLLCKLG